MALLEGLEAVELNLIDFKKDNFEFRLDAEYFLKSNLLLQKKLEKTGYKRIGEFSYVTDGIHTSIDYSETSKINLISATSPRENFFDISRKAYISKTAHSNNPRTALKVNDVIVSTVGTIGNCAVVTKSILPANSDRHVGIIRCKKNFLPNYISTFLLSKYGRFQTWRESTGNVQLNLFIYRIRTLKIANLTMFFQIKISNIVELAHTKREHSFQIYDQAESILLETLGLKNFQPSRENINIKNFKDSFLSSGRLDAEYYQVKYEEITDKILKYHKGTSSIANEFTHKRVFINRLKKKYNYIEIGDINVSDGSYSYNEVFVEDLPANGKMKLQHGNILVSKVRPYRGAVTIIRENISDLVGSAAFTILSEKTEYKKEVLQVLLRTEYFKELMMKFNVGTSYPVIKDEDILNSRDLKKHQYLCFGPGCQQDQGLSN